MSKWIGVTVSAAAVALTALGCAQQPSATAAEVADKIYTMTPASAVVEAGIVRGEITEMKVTERVEKGSDRVVSPARLTGTLRLRNTSANQTVRLVAGKIQYVDTMGQLIKLEAERTEPTLRFAMDASERLDPGQEATQSLDAEFPAQALKARTLKGIRLQLAYIPSAYRQETVSFTVSVSEGK